MCIRDSLHGVVCHSIGGDQTFRRQGAYLAQGGRGNGFCRFSSSRDLHVGSDNSCREPADLCCKNTNCGGCCERHWSCTLPAAQAGESLGDGVNVWCAQFLSLIHISEPTRL